MTDDEIRIAHGEKSLQDALSIIQSAIDAAVAEKDAEIAKLKESLKLECKDWADDDTRVKELVKPILGDLEQGDEHGDFVCVIEIVERLVESDSRWQALVASLTETTQAVTKEQRERIEESGCRIEQLERELSDLRNGIASMTHVAKKRDERIAKLEAILEKTEHVPNIGPCIQFCPRCALEAMKEGK